MPNVVINGEENVVENGVDGKGEGRVQCVVYLNKLLIGIPSYLLSFYRGFSQKINLVNQGYPPKVHTCRDWIIPHYFPCWESWLCYKGPMFHFFFRESPC